MSRIGVMSMEAISFQDGKLFEEIKDCLRQAFDESRPYMGYKDACELAGIKRMLEVIHKRTGVKLVMCTRYPNEGPAVIPRAINPNHIFYDEETRVHPEIMDHFKQVSKLAKNELVYCTVNLKEAKVTGFLAEVEHELLLPTEFMKNGRFYGVQLTVAECAAIVLHELGHPFTFFEMMLRTSKGNQVLSYLVQKQTQAPEEYKVAVLAVGDMLRLNEKQKEMLEKAKDEKDLSVLVLAFNNDKARTELGFDLYDATSCEQMADQFATRMGAGMELITALDKVGGLEQWKNRHRLTFLLELSLYIFSGFLVLASLEAAFIFGFLTLGYVLAFFFANVGDIYDDAEFRPKRVMHEMIDRLKDREITKEERESLLHCIDYLKRLSEDKKGYNTVADYVKLLRPSYRRNRDSELLQKQLEALSANHLFVQAAKLQSLSS